MANKQISDLVEAVTVDDEVVLPIEDGLATKKTKIGTSKNFFAGFFAKLDFSNISQEALSKIGMYAMPPGSILEYLASDVPDGFLIANGAAISRTTYARLYAKYGTRFGAGDGSTTFNLPDLRGVFLRGLDNGKGYDTGRTLGSFQTDAIRNIIGTFMVASPAGTADGAFYYGATVGSNGAASTGNGKYAYFDASRVVPVAADNRPKNTAVVFLIKY